ncbi:biotin/lipoyl-binding protein [Nannocystis pusilla]|uniref:biotin/lipoyl-binding protein n=1 Tax=Nannocystis pusilla TaxID=889268 RepID=UPI003B812F9A
MSEPSNTEAADQAARRVIFRGAALEAHRRASRPGHPLHIVPTWTRWAVTVTILLVGAGLVFAATVRVGEYAEGRAVVRREGRLVVTTSASGTVQTIPVRLGQRVEAGEVLVRLDDASQQAELARVEREYEQRLVELLRAPADDGRRERLAALDGQLQLARARAERSVVAPEPGVVSDVRVRPGQALAPGDAVVAVEQDAAQTVVVGLFLAITGRCSAPPTPASRSRSRASPTAARTSSCARSPTRSSVRPRPCATSGATARAPSP